MANFRLFNADPLTGVKDYISVDTDTKKNTFYTEQDIGGVLERNKEVQKEHLDKRSEMWPTATVPEVILMEWAREAGVPYHWQDKRFCEVVKRKLNDPDYRAFRTGVFHV